MDECHHHSVHARNKQAPLDSRALAGNNAAMPRTILFICTGNYYRSRFAEELFNHLARQRELDWRADSRGLALHLGVFNVGPISPATAIALTKMGIPLNAPIRMPRDLCE